MNLDQARELALARHNELRAGHDNTPPMSLANDLNQQVKPISHHDDSWRHHVIKAQAWANQLLNAGRMYHSSNGQRPGQGENLSWRMDSRGVGNEAAAMGACNDWYNEIKDFDWRNFRNHTGVVGHFTQVQHGA